MHFIFMAPQVFLPSCAAQPPLGTTLVSVAGINTLAEHNLWEEGLIRRLAVPGYSPSLWGNQGRDLKQRVTQSRAERNDCTSC